MNRLALQALLLLLLACPVSAQVVNVDESNAAILSGTIDGATIGAINPKPGTFTSLKSTTSLFGDSLTVDANGRVTAVGDSSIWWEEIVITPTNVRVSPVSSKPDYASWAAGYTYSFDAASPETLYFHEEIPHTHKIGTALEAHVHWSPATTHTGNVAWKIAWSVQDINGTFAMAAGDTLSVRDAGDGTANKHQLVNLGMIPMTGVSNVSAIITGFITRDADKASDTFTGEALYQDMGFHFKADTFGSSGEFVK